jgi:TonB-dependent receptor
MLFGGVSVLALGMAMPAAAQGSDTIETVVVTSQRAAIQSAVKIKENADQIVDSIVADDAGKLPDRSITEVLQRVSGITTTHFNNLGNPDDYTVEGSGPTVRGLQGGTSLLNGHAAFSANGGRQILWGDVPAELMAAVDVFKTYTPDQIEGGLGGTINLRTHKPFDFDGTKIGGMISASYGDLIKQARPKASVMASTRWDTSLGEMGLLVDLSYDDSSYRNDSIQVDPYFPHADVIDNYTVVGSGASADVKLKDNPTIYWLPGGFGYHTAFGYHKRGGAYAAFQWRPNDRLSLYATVFSTVNDSHELNNDFRGGGAANHSNVTYTTSSSDTRLAGIGKQQLLAALSSGTPSPASPLYHLYDAGNNLVYTNAYYDTSFGSGWTPGFDVMKDQCTEAAKLCSTANTFTTASKSFARTTDLNAGANWEPTENWKVRSSFDYIYSKSNSRSLNVQANAIMQPYGLDLRGNYPTVVMGDPAALKTRSSYYWNSTMDKISSNYGQEMQGTIDVEYALNAGIIKKIKFGVRGDVRLEHDRDSGFKWNGLTPTWTSPQHWWTDAASAKDTVLYQFPNFFRGEVNLPGPALFIAPSAVESYDTKYFHTQYGQAGDTTGNATFDPKLEARYKTINVAGYAMVDFSAESVLGMPLSGNAGTRLVYVDNQAVASWTQNSNIAFLYDFNNTGTNQVYATAPVTYPKAEGRVSWTLLPAFNVQVMPTDKIHIRLAGSITMEQPGFPGSYSSYSVGTNSANIAQTFGLQANNLRLKPQMGRNLDLSAEWYGDGGATVYTSIFYKSLKHRQITSFEMQNMSWVVGIPATDATGSTPVPTTNVSCPAKNSDGNCIFVNNATQTFTVPTLVQSNMNSSKEDVIRGAEFGFTKYLDFDFVPSYLKGFGVSGNFTYIDSRARGDYSFDMYGRNISSHLPLSGLSHYAYNAILMYDRDPVSFRLAYNWRSKYLMSAYGWNTQGNYQASDNAILCPKNNTASAGFGGNSVDGTCHYSLPVWSKSFGSLDAGMNYNIDEHFSFNVQSQNLLNTKAKTTMGYGLQEHGRSWFVADRRVSIDLRVNY